METVNETSKFQKKERILTKENWFSGWWKPFSSIFSDRSQQLPVEAVFSLTGPYFSVSPSFWLVNTSLLSTGNSIFFISSLFLLMENITKIWRKPNLQTNDIPASGHHFFYLFFQMFLKVEAVLSYSKSVLYPARANKFSVYGNNIFFIRAILLQLEINGVIKR